MAQQAATSLLVLALAATAVDATQRQKPPGPPPGELVTVAGRALHIRCVGPDTGPTVILEAGAGDYSNRWTAVQDLLAPRIRSCAYDRAGFGWSDGAPQSMGEDNADLHAVLAAAKVASPYVLVGHSIGTLIVRRYAATYPDGILGMVLVGPTHENARHFFPGDNQWKRVREQPMSLGTDFQYLYLARQRDPVPLGDRPLIVVAGTRPDPKVTRPEDIEREKAGEADDLARLSRNSRVVRDPSSGHHVQVDNPKLVAAAIADVVTAAVKGTRLAGKF